MADATRYASTINSFERGDKFFIKSFLLDDTHNVNQWGVTREALERDLKTFLGKPFVVTPDFGHPKYEIQEQYRKGTIIDVGIDEQSGKAFAVAEITDPETREQIKRGEIGFVSPSIGADDEDVQRTATSDGRKRETIKRYVAYHLAGVKRPAFGEYKALIKGQCSGSHGVCMNQLRQVQASTNATNYFTIPTYTTGTTSGTGTWVLPQYAAEQQKDAGDFPFDECLQKMADEGYDDEAAHKICGSIKAKYGSIITRGTSLDREKADSTQMGNDAVHSQQQATTVVDYSAQIEALNASLQALKEENNALRSQYEAAIKRPHIERILSAKVELGKIKADEKETEAGKLYKLDAEALESLASEYAAAASAKKDAAANAAKKPFKIQVNASAERQYRNDDERLLAIRGGLA